VSLDGCSSDDLPNCPVDRGLLFDSGRSSTWQELNGTSVYPLDNDRGMPYKAMARYGLETITLGWDEGQGQSLKSQVIAQISTKDFDLGK
jgi:hypothetical protein